MSLCAGLGRRSLVLSMDQWADVQGGVYQSNTPAATGAMKAVCSFVELGAGWGYLLHDMVDRFQVLMYAMAGLGNTPGTWTAAECWTPGAFSSGYAVPSQTVLPTFLRWQLLFEDPFVKTLWIARATPRTWLATGKTAVALKNAPTSYGRLSFVLQAIDATAIHANVTLGAAFRWPVGGLTLRLRSPRYPSTKISGVTVGGAPFTSFNGE